MMRTGLNIKSIICFIIFILFIQVLKGQKVVFDFFFSGGSGNLEPKTRHILYDMDSCTWTEICRSEDNSNYYAPPTYIFIYQNLDSTFYGAGLSVPHEVNTSQFFPYKEYDTGNCVFVRGDTIPFYLKDGHVGGSFDEFGDFWVYEENSITSYDFNNLNIRKYHHTDVDRTNGVRRFDPLLYNKGVVLAGIDILDTNRLMCLDYLHNDTFEYLFPTPDPSQYIETLFKIRKNCEDYNLYAYIANGGIYEIDLVEKKFVFICEPYMYSIASVASIISKTSSVLVPISSTEGCKITIDLDVNDDSGVGGGDYYISSSCYYTDISITDIDLDVFSDDWIDSVAIFFEEIPIDGNFEYISSSQEKGIHISRNNSQNPTLISLEPHDFIPMRRALRTIRYHNDSPFPTIRDRYITFVAYGKGGLTDTSHVTLHIVDSGDNEEFLFCPSDTIVLVFELLTRLKKNDGVWHPDIDSFTIYDPREEVDVDYLYILQREDCEDDTAVVSFRTYDLEEFNVDVLVPDCIVDTPAIFIVNGSESKLYFLGNDTIISNTYIKLKIEGEISIVQVDENDCQLEYIFEYLTPNLFDIELGDTILRTGNDPFELYVESSKDIDYVNWYLDGVLQESNLNPITFDMGLRSEIYEIVAVAYDVKGCQAIDSLVLIINSKHNNILIPNTIVPDEQHDGFEADRYFGIVGPDDCIVVKYLIFNRWGQLIYEANDLLLGEEDQKWWDGTYKGEKVLSGMYLYSIVVQCFGGEEEEFIGRVLVIR